MWLDYKKAFNSVPHEWLFTALKLAKVPKKIIEAIRKPSKQWSTNLIIFFFFNYQSTIITFLETKTNNEKL